MSAPCLASRRRSCFHAVAGLATPGFDSEQSVMVEALAKRRVFSPECSHFLETTYWFDPPVAPSVVRTLRPAGRIEPLECSHMLLKPASTAALTREQLYAGLRTIRLVADAIREAGTVPAGIV